jgi:hypothetical protein
MTPLRRGKDIVVTPEFLNFVRREAGERGRNLMAFLVVRDHRIAIGEWINRDAGLVREIAAYDVRTGPTRGTVMQVLCALNPQRYSAALRAGLAAYAEDDYQRERFWEEQAAERDELVERIRRVQTIHNRDNPALETIL